MFSLRLLLKLLRHLDKNQEISVILLIILLYYLIIMLFISIIEKNQRKLQKMCLENLKIWNF